ncbi:MAG: tyrosine-type recombinase/integrase [Planctomycetes bacterium]|nr:tyrosine-type recombinase/integrase [Planctomycetota bacterium]
MRAWLFQDHRQKNKLGDKTPWSVGWVDPEGKRRSKRIGSKSMAEKVRRKREGELAAGTYESVAHKPWDVFRKEYETKVASQTEPGSQMSTGIALDHFERIINPQRVSAVKPATIDDYIAKRRKERGLKKNSKVSPATVNKELRHIKAVLRVAHEWGYLAKVPRFRMVREPEKLVRYVTGEHFSAIYKACDAATLPKALPYPPSDWWRALLTFSYMTGWRISEPMALRRDDLDLDAGTAITRHGDNKGKRDDLVPLHSVVVDHLRTIACFEPVVFPWYHNRRGLWSQLLKIQEKAEIHLPCHEKHEHTPSCYVYGFHDLRRAFATVNAETLSGDALQKLMRHRSYSTTQRYINMAEHLNRSVETLHVPEVLRVGAG